MSEINSETFCKFLKSFNDGEYDNHKYRNTITEISRKHSGDRDALVENDFPMYSLDDIARGNRNLRENLPKTADAIYFKEENETLYLIEFKFHNLDDPNPETFLEVLVDELYAFPKKFKCISDKNKWNLNKVKKNYGDDVKYSLILKPIETLKVVIPKLYKEFDKNVGDEAIIDYLERINKRLIVIVHTYTGDGKDNLEKEEIETKGSELHIYFKRLEESKIIDNYAIYGKSKFDDFLKNEIL